MKAGEASLEGLEVIITIVLTFIIQLHLPDLV